MSTSTTSTRLAPALPAPRLAEPVAAGAALFVCLAARLPQRLADVLGAQGWLPVLVVAVAVVSVARFLGRAPFTRVRSQSLGRWAVAEAGILSASFAAGILVAIPLYVLTRATPAWWLVAWVWSATATIAWQAALPLLARARAGTVPPALADRVQALAAQAGIDRPVSLTIAAKGRRRGANAYVVGLGRSRRLVLEPAVGAWPPELVDQVVAHELGHWHLGHNARRLPLAVGAQLAALAAAAAVLSLAPILRLAGVTTAGDPASYPLLLAVGTAVVLPVRCLLAWHSRSQERAADRFALALLDRPADFRAMLRLAVDESGAPRQLPWWRRPTAGHPPAGERATASIAWAARGLQTTGA